SALVVSGEDHSVQSLGVCLVPLETIEWQRPDIDLLLTARGRPHGESAVKTPRAVAVGVEYEFIILARHIAGERIPSIRPPERGSIVGIKRQHLLRQSLSAESLHAKVP